METKSSLNHSNPPDLNDRYYFGHGGVIVSENITSQHCYKSTSRNKSKVRLNDQLIPKPTDINMVEKMIKIAAPKPHPYSSHISQFAMFPSFRSPDDPETGVRAASQRYLNPLIPNRTPDITLMSKTMGSPYRHEILKSPLKTRKKAINWTGEHGFFDHAKPLKGDNQIFYPTPPKTVLPNPKLRDWDLTLSERTSNMLRNLERTHWVTSYQMEYTGWGPANPLKMDDFNEKMSDHTGMDSHSAPLREKSFPVFVPSKPSKGCKRRQGSHVGRSTCSPTAAQLLNPASNQSTAAATVNQHRPQEITAKYNEAPDPNQKGQSQKCSSVSTGALRSELSQEVLHKQQTQSNSFVYEARERENRKVQFYESPTRVSAPQSNQEANTARMADTEQPLDLYNRPLSQGEMEAKQEKSLTELCVKDEPSSTKQNFKAGRNLSSLSQSGGAKDLAGIESHAELLSRAASEQEKLAKGKELPHSISNPCILPRPPVQRVGTVGSESTALSLLDLQNSFSKSAAHRNFNSSNTCAAVNLKDNVVTGKKHDFYGINCYYLHG